MIRLAYVFGCPKSQCPIIASYIWEGFRVFVVSREPSCRYFLLVCCRRKEEAVVMATAGNWKPGRERRKGFKAEEKMLRKAKKKSFGINFKRNS